MSSWSTLRSARTLLAMLPLAVLTACAAPPGPMYVTAETAVRDRTITVGGSAKLELVPDEACIEMTIAAHDASMPKAHARLRSAVDPLLSELGGTKGLVVEPSAVRYAPEYENDGRGGSRHLAGHVATEQINVRTQDFARIPDIVGRAAARGLDGVEVVFYSTAIVARKAELRVKALESAREKARAMAATLGVELGEVVTITEGDAHTSSSVGAGNYLDRGRVDAAPDAPAPPGAIPLFMNVGVVYRVK